MMNKRIISLFFLIALLMAGCHIDAPCNQDELYNDEGECVKCHQYFDASDRGYHLDEEKGRCMVDTDEVCGEGMIDCQTLDNVSKAHCHKGICIIDKCKDDYFIANNKCQLDEDTDFDGIKNPFDPCPNNPTKWDDKWWNDDKTEGIQCEFRDTDRDGVDDFEDDCVTNPGITKLQPGQDCGLVEEKTENGETHIYYHIYNAMDLYNLYKDEKLLPQEKSDDPYTPGKCLGSSKKRTCLGEEWCVVMNCKRCEPNSSGVDACDDYYDDWYDNKFDIVLENDINLDDIYDEAAEIGTAFDGSDCSLKKWVTFKTMAGGNLDGNNHKIYYQRTNFDKSDKSMRCSLPTALFDTIIGAYIHHLNIDLDMKGFGRALFANSLDSCKIEHMNISGNVEHKRNKEFIGSLVGNVKSDYTFESYFNDVHVKNVTVTANKSDFVGGLLGGTVTSDFFKGSYPYSNDLITLESVRVSGRNNVGGVIGGGNIWLSDVDSQIDSVSGNDYVGGFCGLCGLFDDSDAIIDNKLINKVTSVSGNDYVGGVMGYGSFWVLDIDSKVDSVSGNDYVGGFGGECIGIYIDVTDSLLNQVSSVTGDEYVGGFAGLYTGFLNQNLVINRIEKIDGKEDVGGFIGSAFDIELLSESSEIIIYNFIKSIKNADWSIGGFIADMVSKDLQEIVIKNVYNHVVDLQGNSSQYIGLTGGFIADSSLPCQISNVWNRVDSISSDDYAGGFISRLEGDSIIDGVINNIGNIQSFCTLANCRPTAGFIGGIFVDEELGTIPDIQVSMVLSEVNIIKGKDESCGFMCQANQSQFERVHSQIHEIEGNRVSGFVDDVSANARFKYVSSFAVLNTCVSPNNGFLSMQNNMNGNMSNIVSAAFDKTNDSCEAVLSHHTLNTNSKYVSNVYYYNPNELYLPGGSNKNNTNIHDFSDDDVDNIANKVMGNENNVSDFTYNQKLVSLPVAITKSTLEQYIGIPNPDILRDYDFTDSE